ncbi:MAG: SMC family ATPase, partial [Gemmatimonadota bacterium]
MQIDRLRLTNFRQHELTEIELGAGLTGIIGPNGAGKTTLLEAIAWVMYGTKAARGAKDSIRRRGAPPRSKVEVEMEFTLGPRRYRVVRGLNSAELFQDGESTPIANSLDSVTDKITRLLGMSRDEFFNTYFTGQKELAVMAAMSAPERAQFLSRVLGYERIRAAQDRLKERRAGLRVRLDALQSGLPNEAILEEETARATERERTARDAELRSAALLASAEAKLAQVRPAWETIQRTRERAVALDTERRVLESRLASAREKAADIARQAAEAERARLELDEVRVQLAPLGALREEAAHFDRLSA